MKPYGGVKTYSHALLTSAQDVDDWSVSRPTFYLCETPSRLHGPQSWSGRCGEEENLYSHGNLIVISTSSLLLNNLISDTFECSTIEGQKMQMKL